jgi:hypothetical protein
LVFDARQIPLDALGHETPSKSLPGAWWGILNEKCMSTFQKKRREKGKKMNNVRVPFKKWEPVGKMEGYKSKMGTMEEYNSKMGEDIKLY